MSPSHQTVHLSAGQHRSPADGACVMELASMLAGEPFTDRPASVSPTLASALRGYNDGVDDERRQSLKRFAALAVGTAGTRTEERLRRRLVRTAMPDGTQDGVVRDAPWRRLTAGSPYLAVRALGRRIAATDDEAMHQRVLAFLDSLVQVGTAAPMPVVDPGVSTRRSSVRAPLS